MRIGGGYHEVAFEYLRPPHDILEFSMANFVAIENSTVTLTIIEKSS